MVVLAHSFADHVGSVWLSMEYVGSIEECLMIEELSIFCLVYSSRLTCSAAEAPGVCSVIVAQSLVNNVAKYSVGGVLRYSGRGMKIKQCLEGPFQNVQALYEIIKLDPRHTDCKILFEEKRTFRQYETFGMIMPGAGLHGAMRVPISEDARLFIIRLNEPRWLPLEEIWRLEQYDPDLLDEHLPDSGLLRLTYTSTLNVPDPTYMAYIIDGVLQESIKNNPRLQIGGVLSVDPDTGKVAQTLEGSPSAVVNLAAKIEKVSRRTPTGVTPLL